MLGHSSRLLTKPYEPPPDYPMVEQRWPNTKNSPQLLINHRSHSIDSPVVNRSAPAFIYHTPRRVHQLYDHPISVISSPRYSSKSPEEVDEMLRTRQFPEIAGIYSDEQPALRRFTKYNQSINSKAVPPPAPPHPNMDKGSFFTRSSKKPLFFMGNWTFRERNKSARPSLSEAMREDGRPLSMNLSDVRTSSRSKSGEVFRQAPLDFPRNVETRVPVRIERNSMVRKKIAAAENNPSSSSSSIHVGGEFKTTITVDDDRIAVMRPKKEIAVADASSNNNRYSFQTCVQLRKSCPDLESGVISNLEQHRVSKKRTRRAKEKMSQAAWKRKMVKEWTLDDVLLWLQSNQMDEVASLLIGYDLRGEDLLQWNDQTLAQLGVSDEQVRKRLITELAEVIAVGPEASEEETKSGGMKTLFNIVKQTSYDQVLAVETPLTTRDITVTHGRLGCLQITKVNGVNLPLKEQDCLLEINERAGEHFKSALMLTKLISDSNGTPIRFVVLRRKNEHFRDDPQKESSSSGISSSPQTPTE